MSRASVPKAVLLLVMTLLSILWFSKNGGLPTFHSYKSAHGNNQPTVIIYNRIPKTGSTTFTNAVAYDLCRRNGFHAIHINVTKNAYMLNIGDQMHIAKNISEWTAMKPAFYHGHMAFVDFKRLGFPAPIYINIVREPLDRFISYYYFLRYGDDYRVGLKRSKAGNNETFGKCVERRGHDCNPEKMWIQIPYFCGSASFCREVGSVMALETAKQNLINHYLIVGYTKRIRDLIQMSTITKFPTPEDALHKMRNSTIYKMEKEFYDFAVSEFDSAMNTFGLNFLYDKPATNWFDYFINQQLFSTLLNADQPDRHLLGQLCDQFVENALLSSAESKNQRKKLLESEANYLEQKSNKLWTCAWCCASRLGWDLEGLLESSTIIKIFSLISRFVEITFNTSAENDLLSFLSQLDDSKFDSKNLFVAWIYARLIVIIDRQARVPQPPQKPTVSNPANQTDTVLLEADRSRTFIVNVRKHTRNAVTFLENLLNIELPSIEVPTSEFFCIFDNRRNPSPNRPTHLQISRKTFILRTQCDLLLAHFAAAHVQSARALLAEVFQGIKECDAVHSDLSSLCGFSVEKLKAFDAALSNERPIKRPKTEPGIYVFRISPKIIHQPMDQLDTALCTFDITVDDQSKNYKTYRIRENSTSGSECSLPLITQMQNCFNYTKLKSLANDLANESKKPFRCSTPNGRLSPYMGELMEKYGGNDEVMLFFFMQLERLVNTSNVNEWRSNFEEFVTTMQEARHPIAGDLTSVYASLEILRASLKVWNHAYGSGVDWNPVQIACLNIMRLLITSWEPQKRVIYNAERLSAVSDNFTAFLINAGHFDSIIKMPQLLPNLSTKHLSFAFTLITTLSSDEKTMLYMWKMLSQIFETTKRELRNLLSKKELKELLTLIKNEKVIDYFLSFLIPLYNKALGVTTTTDREKLPFAEGLKMKSPEMYVNKSILDLKRKVPPDAEFPQIDRLNVEYLLSLIDVLLQNVLQLCPLNTAFIRQSGDVAYVKKDYCAAARHYVDVLCIYESGMHDHDTYANIVTNVMIAKLVHCLYAQKYYALAAITGQMKSDLKVHINFIPQILKNASKSADATISLFRYIYSIPVFEAMAGAYDRHDYNAYYVSLLRLCPSRALNDANSAEIMGEEVRRRRSQFVDRLYRIVHTPATFPVLPIHFRSPL